MESSSVLRIIVDECVGHSSAARQRLEQILPPGTSSEWTFLSHAHAAIPDSEILGRLLGPGAILLTRDRALHNQAVSRGFRSYFLDEHGNLRRRKFPDVPVVTPKDPGRKLALQRDYSHPPSPITAALRMTLSERELKQRSTRRRRIRSYFGSEFQIASASVTIGARRSGRAMLYGYFLALSGCTGVKGIRASEGYGKERADELQPAHCLIHALQELYLLQLEHVPTELFVIPGDALALAHNTSAHEPSGLEPNPAAAARVLLRGLRQVKVSPCVKGRFYDAMHAKLHLLATKGSNELVPVEFNRTITALLQHAGAPPSPPAVPQTPLSEDNVARKGISVP